MIPTEEAAPSGCETAVRCPFGGRLRSFARQGSPQIQWLKGDVITFFFELLSCFQAILMNFLKVVSKLFENELQPNQYLKNTTGNIWHWPVTKLQVAVVNMRQTWGYKLKPTRIKKLVKTGSIYSAPGANLMGSFQRTGCLTGSFHQQDLANKCFTSSIYKYIVILQYLFLKTLWTTAGSCKTHWLSSLLWDKHKKKVYLKKSRQSKNAVW